MPVRIDIFNLLRARPWRGFVLLVALAVVATAAFGGFREAAPSSLMTRPPLPGNARIDAGALAVTPLRAWIAMRRPGGIVDSERQQQYLVLRVRVENLTDTGYSAASYLMNDLVLFTDPIEAPGVVRGRGEEPGVRTSQSQSRSDDHSFGFSLPPGLPVEIDMVWPYPAEQELPPRLTWGVVGRRFVEQTYLTRESGWIKDRGKARWELPVQDRRVDEAPQ